MTGATWVLKLGAKNEKGQPHRLPLFICREVARLKGVPIGSNECVPPCGN